MFFRGENDIIRASSEIVFNHIEGLFLYGTSGMVVFLPLFISFFLSMPASQRHFALSTSLFFFFLFPPHQCFGISSFHIFLAIVTPVCSKIYGNLECPIQSFSFFFYFSSHNFSRISIKKECRKMKTVGIWAIYETERVFFFFFFTCSQ